MRSALLSWSALGVICTAPAIADHRNRPQEQPSKPSSLLQFEVTALGLRGEPVADLRSSECQVSEDGKREAVAFFRYEGNKRQESDPAGPNEFSNRSGFAAHPTVIVLDLLSEGLLTWSQAGEGLFQSLLGLESGDGTYLYVLTSRGTFYPVYALPRTAAESRAVSPAWTEKIRPLFEVVSRDLSGFRPIEDQDPGSRAGLTVQTLKVFASSMAAFPGRKNLVWITHGVPSAVPGIDEGEMIDLSPQIRRLGEALVQANIALYPVAQPASGVRAPMGLDILQLLSGLTGGRAYSSDSVGRAITEARTDARGSYVVGYYPRRQKDDGKHHSFRVTCARKGVRLRTQQGYWAFPMQSSTDEREQAAFEAAAARRFDDSRIGLRGTISLFGGPVRTVRFQIKVDSADLLLTNQNDRYYVDIALELVAYSADGAVQHVTTTPLQLSLTQEQVQQVSKEGIEVMRDLPLDGSTEKIRLVIFDRGSNVTGSVTIPMAVADMNPEGPSSGKSSGKEERRQSAER